MNAAAFRYTLDPFTVSFDACTREPLSWKEELRRCAWHIANDAGSKPIILCWSGGVDNEVIAEIFFQEAIHFSVLSLEYSGGVNKDGVRHVQEWCASHTVEHKKIRLDLKHFFEQEIDRFADDGYMSIDIFRYIQLKFLESVESFGGYAVMGGQEPSFKLGKNSETEEKNVCLEFLTGFIMPLRWIEKHRSAHCPYFYFSSPEACLAFLRIDIIDMAVKNPWILRHEQNGHFLRNIIYQALWPKLHWHPRDRALKKALGLLPSSKNGLKEKFETSIEKFQLPVVEFRKQLENRITAGVNIKKDSRSS